MQCQETKDKLIGYLKSGKNRRIGLVSMKQKLIQCKSDCDQEEDSVVLDLSDDESFV